MNLVHMLDAIRKQKTKIKMEEEHRVKTELNSKVAAFLTAVSIEATTLIESNYNITIPSDDFTEEGLVINIPGDSEFLEYVPLDCLYSRNCEAWVTFAEGWRKAGIFIRTKEGDENSRLICFSPIMR